MSTAADNKTIKALLAARAVEYARTLISCGEPIKALKVLEEVAPVSALEHQEVQEMSKTLRKQVDQFFSDEDYVRRYTVYDNGGVPNEPFSDVGLLPLFRAQATIELAGQKKPARYLSIGGGEGTVPLHVLNNNPDTKATLSELLGVGGSVAAALEAKHPGRVSVTGRYDTPNRPTENDGSFDMVECLEVVEHVTDDLLFLQNIRESLVEGGLLVLSTPNSTDWVEQKLVSDFGPGNWYHHVRAYTPRSLATVLRKAGFKPTIVYTEKTLYVMARRDEPVSNPYVEQEDYVDSNYLDKQADKRVNCLMAARMLSKEVPVVVFEGVLLTS